MSEAGSSLRIVTTSSRPDGASLARARALAAALGAVFLPPDACDGDALVVEREGLAVRVDGGTHRWHPGLLHARLEAGFRHPMARAARLAPGDRVLDLTLGLGIDSAFFASLTGRRVIGVEASPILATVSAAGLRVAGHDVAVVCARAEAFLDGLPDRSFDVVVCDPLFRSGPSDNAGTTLYRRLGDPWRPDGPWLRSALRVVRKGIVVKDEHNSGWLESLRPDQVFQGVRSRTRYGRFVVSSEVGP